MPTRVGGMGQSEVNIGWYGARTSRETSLRRAPGGAELIRIGKGRRVGRQSEVNPARAAVPPRREPRSEHVWCFDVKTGRAGWIALADVQEDDAINLARAGQERCGPADVDFQVHRTTPRVRRSPDAQPKRRQGSYVVRVEDAMLRYAPHSTAFEWLQEGDRLTASAVVHMGEEIDYFVKVESSACAPVGTRGYIIGMALKKASP